jgi:hypothetical protein
MGRSAYFFISAAVRSTVRVDGAPDGERVDAQEDERYGSDHRGDELPEELQRSEQRLARIREARTALEAQAAERERARRAELRSQGKKPGRPRDGRDPFAAKPTAQRNFTDPESRLSDLLWCAGINRHEEGDESSLDPMEGDVRRGLGGDDLPGNRPGSER